MANSIWKILGIKKTQDIAEIKKAYAAKLKVTRPDKDPVAFQLLREAREKAEWQAKSNITVHEAWDDEEIADKPTSRVSPIAPIIEAETPRLEPDPGSTEPTVKEMPLEDILELWLKGKAPEPDKLQLHRAFRHIERLELHARTGLEVTLLLAIQENFDWRLAPLDEAESTEFTPPFNSTADGAILILCEEFGWFDNDRRISELLFWEPEKLADQLRSLRDYGRISGGWVTSPPTESRWKWFNGKYWFIIFIALQSLRLCSDHETRRVPPPTDSRLELQSLIRS